MQTLKKTAWLLLAFLLVGCMLSVSAFALDEDIPVEIDYSALDNETAVFTYLTREMGLNAAAASGVMANIQYESGFDPTIWGDGGTSHGLCQWHNGRCAGLSSFCAENGYDEGSVYGQMAYLQYELETSYPGVLEALRTAEDNASGAYDAAWYWCYYFEVPANREYQADQRGQAAANDYYPYYADLAQDAVIPAADSTLEAAHEASDSQEAQTPSAAPGQGKGYDRPHHGRRG